MLGLSFVKDEDVEVSQEETDFREAWFEAVQFPRDLERQQKLTQGREALRNSRRAGLSARPGVRSTFPFDPTQLDRPDHNQSRVQEPHLNPGDKQQKYRC